MAPATQRLILMDGATPPRPRTAKRPPGRAMPERLPLIRTAAADSPVPARSTRCSEGFLATAISAKTGAGFPLPRFPGALSRRRLKTNECGVLSGHRTKVRRRAGVRSANETVALDLRQLRETCRQKIDECFGFRRQKVAVRIDSIGRR